MHDLAFLNIEESCIRIHDMHMQLKKLCILKTNTSILFRLSYKYYNIRLFDYTDAAQLELIVDVVTEFPKQDRNKCSK